MAEFWIDTDSFVAPHRGPYGFDIAPGFWAFLEQQTKDGTIGSCRFVYEELQQGEDELLEWAKRQRVNGLFIEPDGLAQAAFTDIADYVNTKYPVQHASQFLSVADPWIIACAKAYGGSVVTFEVRAPASSRPKIPDVCDQFDVSTLNIYQLLRKLRASIGRP